MKIKYKHQKFQQEAAQAVVDVFKGQPKLQPSYMIDQGTGPAFGGDYQGQISLKGINDMGWSNGKIVPELTDQKILDNIKEIQRKNQIEPSNSLEGKYNLTIEMETGVGKTYTYIKTMYELNKAYGWTKFIIVVPSIAIREGVNKTFESTEEHFAEEYGKKIRFFIYKSTKLERIDQFASDSSIQAMIINSQAFNAKGKDARRIYMKLDEFRSRRPIDIIAKTNPILIIDEPQSVEGKQTKERLKEFNPLFTLRYSATPREKYNLIYRLDALEAYNKHLVKKISVLGTEASGTTASDGFVYLEGLNLSKSAPTANITIDFKGKSGLRQKTITAKEGYNLFDYSGELEEYKDNFVVKHIDGRDNSVELLNGIKLFVGEEVGAVNEEQFRRIQIRETINAHLEREQALFHRGIKVLSLFFIDEVAHYREYDKDGMHPGVFAKIFEEEYTNAVESLKAKGDLDPDYLDYLNAINVADTHAGYFSKDKKGHFVNSVTGDDKRTQTSNDADAYDLIMKNKELLLDINPRKSPVRFIFSHSALREGWDNPNVFQICTLKQSSSEVRKRQEVGRGMRLCVNQLGERMDENVLGKDVQNINVLTIIPSESYEKFAKGLQSEISEVVADRPVKVTAGLFEGRRIKDDSGNEMVIDMDKANSINFDLISNGYVDRMGSLTDKYFEDKDNGNLNISDEFKGFSVDLENILDSVYNPSKLLAENAREKNVELQVNQDKLASKEFKALWSKINSKTVYAVDFDSDELVQHAIVALNAKLKVPKIYFKIEKGYLGHIESKQALENGQSMVREKMGSEDGEKKIMANASVKYDLVGELVNSTGLTRKDIIRILQGINEDVFNQFKDNPEEFIIRAGTLINEEKATVVVEHITYHILDEKYDTDIFTEPTMKGKLGVNAMKTEKHLYDNLIYDSTNEKNFAEKLDTSDDVVIYVKLPSGFYISTPVGHYNPDWAIAFKEGSVKHIYFVAETKGSMSNLELRRIESDKIECARKHFAAISSDSVKYDVVKDYDSLMEKVMK